MGIFRHLIGIVAAVWLAAAAHADPLARDGVWAQSYVDRPADPAVTFGQLPNGLRYAVMHNATPRRQVSLRLVIGSGSLAERDDQQGIAHFVEHMAFRGSTHVPDGELIRTLERLGLSYGADTNAFTSQDTTFYQFDLPENDAATVTTGLHFLRETASEVSFVPGAVDTERAVILAEERLRDGPSLRALRASLTFVLAGQRAADRIPIGTPASIAAITPAGLREFYAAHYRPANATLIVVGDVDPAAIVAQITAMFGDWTGPPVPPPPIEPGVPAARATAARVFTGPGVSHNVAVAWVRPYDFAADTVAHRRQMWLAAIARQIFNQRLADIAAGANPPFIVAGLSQVNLFRSANVTSIEFHGTFDRWPEAMATIVGEQRRQLRDGVTPAELARTIAQIETGLATNTAGAATRGTAALASALVATATGNLAFAGPAAEQREFAALRPTIDAAAVDAAFRDLFAGSGPLLFLSAAGTVPGGEPRLLSAYAAAVAAPIPAATATAAAVWPYDSFGAPGRVVSRQTVGALGVTSVVFANGATLLVKPTAFARDGIDVDVRFGRGRAGLPLDRTRAFWTASGIMPVFVNGGTARLSATELQRLLAGHVAGLELATDDAAFDLRGHTRPADLTRELQLMAAYLGEPGFRPEAFDRLKSAMASSLLQLDSEPNLVLLRALPRRLHDDDPRWTTMPSRDDVAATTVGDARALFAAALTEGPRGVVVVGDVDVDRVIAAVAATIGALPPPVRPAPVPRDGVRFPAPTAKPVVVPHQGRADKAIAVAAWRATDFYANPADVRALLVAMAVLRSRLTDRMRGADGLTYSPQVDGSFSDDFDGFGTVETSIELAPDRVDEFYTKLDAIVRDLGAHEPTPDEFDRARAPIVEARMQDLQNNVYWLIALARATRDPREYATILERVASVQAVTAAAVRRVALRYLRPEATVRLVVRPPVERSLLLKPPPPVGRPPCNPLSLRACPPDAGRSPG